MLTPKVSSVTSLTVNDTPSTATLPLTAMKRARSRGRGSASGWSRVPAVADSASPTPSTWPETRCPPSSSPSRSERSRLTRVPTRQRPSVVLLSVSAEASAANQSGADLDRGQAAAGAADRGADRRSRRCPARGLRSTSRMSAPPPSGVMPRTVPSAVTMPVNIQASPAANSVSMSSPSVRLPHARTKRGMASSRSIAERLHRGPAIAAHDRRRMEPGDAVHQVGPQQRRGELGAAFDQQPGEPGLAQRGQRRRRDRRRPRRRRTSISVTPRSAKARRRVGVGALADQDPGRRSRRGRDQRAR